ncbi:MAG: ATP-binding cassette domain-containing protein [Candidatus Thorarchaeota archaeon]|nr:MAG: ATP-binding cassette domain-containing protein [Candidatus Thorarchaeota archaeon]
MIDRVDIERMKGDELINLARVLKVPITKRTIQRSWLIDELMGELEKRSSDGSPKDALHQPAIELDKVTKRFGKTVAVRNLDLQVHPGEILGLVGPNGAGKTTTLRMLTGIIRASSGVIHVNGHDINDSPILAKSSIGYIPEKPTCYPSLTAREYVTFIARIYKVPQETALIRMREYVDLFQFDEFINSYIGTLSKGNLQRVLLIGIFVREPPYILALDEPIYGLDPRGAWNLKKLLKRMRDEGSAILLSTHILEVASDLCDRFVIMNHGDVVGRGTLEELLAIQPEATSLEEVFLGLTGGIPE